MSFDTEACGARIRELRKGNKLSQERLAEELNITDSHLRRIESGTRTGSIDLLIDIAAYLRCRWIISFSERWTSPGKRERNCGRYRNS